MAEILSAFSEIVDKNQHLINDKIEKFLFLVKKSELQIWSLQIFSFQRNSRSQLQPSPCF
jgi:hypothetical protein